MCTVKRADEVIFNSQTSGEASRVKKSEQQPAAVRDDVTEDSGAQAPVSVVKVEDEKQDTRPKTDDDKHEASDDGNDSKDKGQQGKVK